MKAAVLVLAALQLQAVLGGHFSVRMPFTNPAGVTYLEGPAPAGLAAGPAVAYAAPAAYAAAPAAYAAQPAYAAYAAPAVAHGVYAAQAVAPVAYAAPHVKTASVGYAAVPTVHHVPAVQDVPYTRLEATAGVVQKLVDVAKPAVATRRFQIRRPAIQKQFYDIEERVVVRPAGSALVELDQPLSKTQKGETVVTAAAPVVAAPVLAHAKVLAPAVHAVPAYPAYHGYPTLAAAPIVAAQYPQQYPVQEAQPQQPEQLQQEQQQEQQEQQQEQQQFDQPQEQPQEQPQQQFEQPQQPQQQFEQPQQPQQQFDQPQQDEQQQDDSIEVSNPEIVNARSAAPAQEQPAAAAPQARAIPTPEDLLRQFASSPALRQLQAEGEALEAQRQQLQARMAQLVQQQQQQRQDAEALAARQRNLAQARATQTAGQTEARFASAPTPAGRAFAAAAAAAPAPAPRQPAPVVESRSLGLPASLESLIPAPAPRSAADVVPSVRNLSPEQSQQNQQRLIELLTAQVQHEFLNLLQGGVAEVGSARAGPAAASVGDSGQVRARVLSATPAPEHAEPANERVQTRRVVVSRPIETVQEIDVVEPFTKIHRLAVNQPAVFKTAVQDVARVHTSVPVYGKALTPYAVYHK